MITIRVDDDLSHIDLPHLRDDVQKLMQLLDYEDFDLGIRLTTNEVIKQYNKEFRGKDVPTDILSFPYHTDLVVGERIVHQSEDDKNLGDIIISIEYVQDKASQDGQPLDNLLRILLVHGVCHLLGYTHDADDDYEVMQRKESEFLIFLKTP